MSHFLCDLCCITFHIKLPFHRIQRFNGQHFENSDLDHLGLVIDLRQHDHECIHHSGFADPQPVSDPDLSEDENNDSDDDNGLTDPSLSGPATDQPQMAFRSDRNGDRRQSNLIFVSSTGIFKRRVKWCRCPNHPADYIQLLRAKLFPASFLRPETVFTFEVLDHFHLDALECKTAALNFMSKIIRISNESFPGKVPVRISRLLTVQSTYKWNRTAIVNFSESPVSGEIFIIEFVQE